MNLLMRKRLNEFHWMIAIILLLIVLMQLPIKLSLSIVVTRLKNLLLQAWVQVEGSTQHKLKFLVWIKLKIVP